MIGAVLFVIFFLLFLAVTLGMPTLPPGEMIHELLAIPKVDYPVLGIPAWLLITAIVNGLVYGFIIWLIYSVASLATRSRKKERQPYTPPPTAPQQQRSMPPTIPPRRHTPPRTTPPPQHTPPPQISPAQHIAPQVPTPAPQPRIRPPEPTPTPSVPSPQQAPAQAFQPPPEPTPVPIMQPTYTPPPPTPSPSPPPAPTQAPPQPSPTPAAPALQEEFTVSSENLVDRVKDLLHEGNVTRIVVKDDRGKVLLDMPASIGVAGTIAAPWLAGLGAIAALATRCTISVVRKE